ncbi:glycosyltransferase family 2 protein [Nitratidesulfovibrio vulgaris]|uniref:glycosyltransferase family 2 protein n=1 Tax=Nitratidesulfovibrio vulgaris TaxID=881 RepID=UPI0023008C48|nr:glycosyltransferase [Nitratidesulfovibrio vulgaris]WCB45549.1 glycosyltransferase [Nitratidesulfovibrio vulgaris]
MNAPSSPLITVIIPVYNVEEYVEKCLTSVLAQTYAHLEVLVVDDGSTDDSASICQRIANQDSRVSLIRKHNQGQAVARNVALEKARGNYIAFADADDWLEPDMLSSLLNITLQQECDIAVCAYNLCKENRAIILGQAPVSKLSSQEATLELFKDRWLNNFVWNKLFKRELFEDIKFPAGCYFEEIPIMYKLFQRSSCVAFTKYAGYNYRIRRNSTIGSRRISTELDSCENHIRRYNNIIHTKPDLEHALWSPLVRCFLHTVYISMQNSLSEQRTSRTRRKLISTFINKNRSRYKKHLGLIERSACRLMECNTWMTDLVLFAWAIASKVLNKLH